MVKGVNKTIIEVNNTGSRYFEKIVFYVTPQYGNLNAKQLKKAASTFSFNFDNTLPRKSLRKTHKKKKTVYLSVGIVAVLLAITGILIVMF